LVSVPPATRRRAVFKIAKRQGGTEVGFHALKSHTVVDMRECLVLTPSLVRLASRLRSLLNDLLANGQNAEAHVTEACNGIDIAFRASVQMKPAIASAFARWASESGTIRVTWNGELAFECAIPTVRFGAAEVKLPPHSFLQPTEAGEAALRAQVLSALKGAKIDRRPICRLRHLCIAACGSCPRSRRRERGHNARGVARRRQGYARTKTGHGGQTRSLQGAAQRERTWPV
jgi:23S rRNA (uracil1939-C5)-methyltransferase